MPDPIHQFEIQPIVPIKIFGWDVSFTNSSAFMLHSPRDFRVRPNV